ncbi:MAG TPA: hypothetical protein VE689_08195 [Candidatus Udaeobacter sp.]|jgi:hypothetical protein|nr:hypothetical protein [Candidatus Udaeobacter sp.]
MAAGLFYKGLAFSSAIPHTQGIPSTIGGFEIDTGGTVSYARGLAAQWMRLPQERGQ